MAGRNKLYKFEQLLSFGNVFQNFEVGKGTLIGAGNKEVQRKGSWHELQFQNDNDIVLELGCGRGEYSIGLASIYPNKNFIGVDVKGARIYQGAKKAIDEKLDNVAFLRTRIEYLSQYFEPGEVSEIWITFPDPFLERRKSNRRMTSEVFLKEFRIICSKPAIIHLKTDERILYDYSLEVFQKAVDVEIIEAIPDIYQLNESRPELEIRTYYETKHIADGKQVCYIRARLV